MLDSVDFARLATLLEDVKAFTVERLLPVVPTGSLGDDDRRDLAVLADHCSFDHGGILVFPDDVEDLTQVLRRLGLDVRVPVPSVVVRDRLARRYTVSHDILDVSIVRATRNENGSQRGIEVFCLSQRTARNAAPAMVGRERDENSEGHFALNVDNPDPEKLNTLGRVLRARFGMRADGGGYNPDEDAERGGRSVLYFSASRGGRVELTFLGEQPDIVASHLRESDRSDGLRRGETRGHGLGPSRRVRRRSLAPERGHAVVAWV